MKFYYVAAISYQLFFIGNETTAHKISKIFREIHFVCFFLLNERNIATSFDDTINVCIILI